MSVLIATTLMMTLVTGSTDCAFDRLEREEITIAGPVPGIRLFVMRVASPSKKKRGAVVLVHGAGSGGSAIWDLRHDHYSMMRTLACAGFDSYSVDLRGFGGSTMPKAMLGPAEASPPSVRAVEAVTDLEAAVRYAMKRSKTKQVDVLAWSWGCVVGGLFATRSPSLVRRLILYAPVYDRRWPERHITDKAWRVENRKALDEFSDPKREEDAVWREHIAEMFRFNQGKDDLRLPNGPYLDIYGPDAPIWDAKKVQAPTLIIRGTADRASVDQHVRRLFDDLVGVSEKRYVQIAGGNHFLMRERRAEQFQRVVLDWLTIDSFQR